MTTDTEQRLQRLAEIMTLLDRVDRLAAAERELADAERMATLLHRHIQAARVEVAAAIDRVHPAAEGVPTTESVVRSGKPRSSVLSDE